MKNMINKDFPGLPQRSIYSFLATFPSFYPVSSPGATVAAQEAAYAFIRNIYTQLYDDPSLLGFTPIADDSLGTWEGQKAKPGLVPKLRGIICKVEEFIEFVYNISRNGRRSGDSLIVVRDGVKPAAVKRLSKFGVKTSQADDTYTFVFPPGAAKGLALLAKISSEQSAPAQKPYFLFSRGVFDTASPWTREVFGNMVDDRGPFDRLVDFLTENNYRRIDGRQMENRMAQASLDYVKNYGGKDEPLKWGWAERTHGGMEFLYEETRKNQPLFTLRIPYFQELLRHSKRMNSRVNAFVQRVAKKCNNCRYCVQTDKTEKKPLKFVPIGECNICPLFCGFQFRWRTLDNETVDDIIAMLQFIDDIFRSGGPGEQALKRWAK